jgi:hypothetical protein
LIKFIESRPAIAPLNILGSDTRMGIPSDAFQAGETTVLVGLDKQITVPATTSIAARPAQRSEDDDGVRPGQLI